MDDFEQAVKVHEILGDAADSVLRGQRNNRHAAPYQRLYARAADWARSVADRSVSVPAATDSLDEQLDDHVLEPNRRAIVRRTVALERWLADHGFKSGQPMQMVRSHRAMHHHGQRFETPIARPVARHQSEPVDDLLTDYILDTLHRRATSTAVKFGRVSVIPGFILVELSPQDFEQQFLHSKSELPTYGHIAIGKLEPGPVMVTTRDLSGEMLAHAVLAELGFELAALSDYAHGAPMPTPAGLRLHPSLGWQLPITTRRQPLDVLAHELVAARVRHLPSDCRVEWPLSLNDLGFSPSDWLPIEEQSQLDPITQHIAATYLASLLLGKTLIRALNEHPNAYESVRFQPTQALDGITCSDGSHDHYRAANSYINFVRNSQTGELGPKLLDGLYRRSIDIDQDFRHTIASHHPVRLSTYQNPLHPIKG